MGCETVCSENPNPAKVLFLLLFIVMIGGLVLFSLAHATERHGDVAIQICNTPPERLLHNPMTGRSAGICKLDNDKFGVQIFSKDGELITAFPNKGKNIDAVIRYLLRKGYQ